MRTNIILALSGVIGFVSAVPFAGPHHQLHHHYHNKRAVVWETKTEEVVVTVPITKTVWLEPGETPPTAAVSAAEAPSFTPPAPPVAPISDVAPVASNSASAPAPAAFTPPVVQSPAAPASAPTSSPYVAPVPSSTYVPPPAPATPSSSVVAPIPSPASPASSGAPESDLTLPASAPAGLTSGMAKSGTSYTGDLTYYGIGMGACGWANTEDEAVVAISQEIWDKYPSPNPNNNPICGKYVTIVDANGNNRYFKVVDRCTGCAAGDLDLPEKFFNSITNNGDGRVGGMHWSFT